MRSPSTALYIVMMWACVLSRSCSCHGSAANISVFLKAPIFSRWFDDFVQTHKYGPAILKAREGMGEWFAQDALDRARSKIGLHRPLSEAMDGRWDAFRQAVADDLHGIYRMERELSGGKIAPAGAYESARLARASASIADGALRWGYPVKNTDGSFSWKGQGLEEILKPIAGNLNDGLLYFVGKSADELLRQGREHLFTRAEVNAMLALRRPEFDKAFAGYQAWNRGILDFAEEQGVDGPNWLFLTGAQADIDRVLGRLGHILPSPEQHSTQLIAGDVAGKRWSKIRPDAPPTAIAQRLQLMTLPLAGR